MTTKTLLRPFAIARRLSRWQRDRRAILESCQHSFAYGITDLDAIERALRQGRALAADLRRLADLLEQDVERTAFEFERVEDDLHRRYWRPLE